MSRIHGQARRAIRWGALGTVTALALLLSHEQGRAQFEYVYGGASCVDGGEAVAVAPFSEASCGVSAGYITVGWTYSTPGSSCLSTKDIFVVRTDAFGVMQWERSYDIGGNDHAYDVKQTSDSGFIVVGTTDNTPPSGEENCFGDTAATYDIFLLKLDPCGNVEWVNTYGTDTATEVGYEVIEAVNGNGTTTNPGDFVVAGYHQGTSRLDALLFRTTSTGVLLWDMTYGTAGMGDEFHALTEATFGTTNNGDIIATGRSSGQNFAPWDVYLVRVNGNTGAIGAAPQGAMVCGGNKPEFGLSVVELQAGANAGGIVVAGFAQTVPAGFAWTSAEIYMMRTGANVCAGPVADMLYGDQGNAFDVGANLKEITTVGTAGNLIVTGQVTLGGGHGQADAFLMEVNQALAIVGAGAGFNVYGGSGNDVGRGVVEDVGNNAYVLAGSERSNKAGSSPADPEQLYLVRTSAAGVSDCENTPIPLTTSPGFAWVCAAGTRGSVLDTCEPDIEADTLDYEDDVCPDPQPKRSDGADDPLDLADAGIVPQPVAAGSSFTIDLGEEVDAEVTAALYDISGRLIDGDLTLRREGSTVVISTAGWGAGSYHVRIAYNGGIAYRAVLVSGR